MYIYVHIHIYIRAGKVAHTAANVVRAAVFHAPMFALNAVAHWKACEPTHTQSPPAEGARMCRRGLRGRRITHAHTRARARTQHVGARVRRARIGDPFVCVARRMDIDTCMHHVSIYICYTSACSIDGWPNKESAPRSHTCRVLAHRRRPHAIARLRNNTHAYPFTYSDFASIDICMYTLSTIEICVYPVKKSTIDMCVSY
jgi:hypothetical protein